MRDGRYRVVAPVEPPAPDRPGHNLKPDPQHVADAEGFGVALRELHTWAGEPSLRELARRCGGCPSRSTFRNLLHSRRLPSIDLVLVFVDALGLGEDREVWRAAWRRLALRSHDA